MLIREIGFKDIGGEFMGKLLNILLCMTVSGCLSYKTPAPYTAPSFAIRRMEANDSVWHLIRTNKNVDSDGIAARIHAYGTLIHFRGKYHLVWSSQNTDVLIKEASIPARLKNTVYIPALSVSDHPTGEKYISLDGEVLISYAAVLDIDMIFEENKWCDWVLIDDLSEGLVFRRETSNYLEMSYDEFEELSNAKIVKTATSYDELLK
jgi:hypothetical protein